MSGSYRFFLLLALAGCAGAPPRASFVDQPVAQTSVPDRFKPRYDKLLVDSKEAPEWLVQGAGCALGQMTAIKGGEAVIVAAHLCVGVASAPAVTNATCEAAEAQAWTNLAKLFGVQKQAITYTNGALKFGAKAVIIQGARPEASWRGSFNGAPICALQLAWPDSERQALEATWVERAERAQKLHDDALAKGIAAVPRCEALKQAAGLLAAIPGNRLLSGSVQNSTVLEQVVRQALGTYCVVENTLVLGLSCSFDDAPKTCPKRLRAGLAQAIAKSGWKVVGSAIDAAAVEQIISGDQGQLRRITSEATARYLGAVQVSTSKVGQRGKIMLCRSSLDFRLLDGSSGSAAKSLSISVKSGGLNSDQCVDRTSVLLGKKAAKPLREALKK